jgi:hypothetical protein
MKLTTVAVFGVGYLLGTRAGRERYEQILRLTQIASGKFATSDARRMLEEYGARLEAYAAGSRMGQSRAGQPGAGGSRRVTGAGSGGRTRS